MDSSTFPTWTAIHSGMCVIVLQNIQAISLVTHVISCSARFHCFLQSTASLRLARLRPFQKSTHVRTRAVAQHLGLPCTIPCGKTAHVAAVIWARFCPPELHGSSRRLAVSRELAACSRGSDSCPIRDPEFCLTFGSLGQHLASCCKGREPANKETQAQPIFPPTRSVSCSGMRQ